jgi:LPXTG-motif cell wall-anchored protein
VVSTPNPPALPTLPPQTTVHDQLPITGAESGTVVGFAAGLIAIGVIILVFARRTT